MKILKTIFLAVSLLAIIPLYAHAQEIQLRIFVIDYADVNSLLSVANDLKSPDGKVSVDKATRSLIVYDYPSYLNRIAEVITQLNVPQPQVEIKVLVAEISDSFLSKSGISAGHIVIPQEQWSATLELLKKDTGSSIQSETMVRTTSNQPAKLAVSQDVLLGQSTYTYSNGTELVTFERQKLGDFLEVLPRVNYDKTIDISVRPTMSELQPNGTPYSRSVITQVVINDGDTIAIGGVTKTTKTANKSGFFAFTPLYNENKAESRKMIMFLTAKAAY